MHETPGVVPAPRLVRIADVAAEAGVSSATVSKVLGNTGQLRDDTRQRVREAAERLGFTARARERESTGSITVALLTGDSVGRFSLPILLGAENALSLGQIMVLLCDTRDDPLREQYYLDRLAEQNVDGIIVTGGPTNPRTSLRTDLPVVYAHAPSTGAGDTSVIADDERGARLLYDHLTTLGRVRIAHVTGPSDQRSARVRADATLAAADARGLSLAHEPLFGAWTEAWGRAAADILLDHAETAPDAITCGNDQIARGVAERLRERGVGVPDDIAITGFDDWDVVVEGCRPPLTTIDRRLGEIGRRSAELLLDAIGGSAHPGIELVEPRLVARGSTLGVV
ncbi:LacI family DNA-binding transcriptional regulator [Planctomonas sp. JC2975]|uniref:LacI family DNA-binding transcriptional regulator n=1 Tax=Planctomonas sp. JC2975 TaxID=2729626 RepID=UPI0014749277|nr:LacI family DNA-binding transcriptional regulator [Planctomonas sp. JC2975]NNC13779.1 LacI family DNA-binding transcriptional regulator [Planctomonas sp. JC2975]